MKREIERKGKDMTVPRYGEGDGQGHLGESRMDIATLS